MPTVYNLMGTISETAKRAADEHIGISKTHIRRLVTSGEVPSVRSGSKYLINWNHLMEYLNNPKPKAPQRFGVVHPISEKGRTM
ncbi:MAG: excisionase family DNA-binding protein [Peptococcia bacterium]